MHAKRTVIQQMERDASIRRIYSELEDEIYLKFKHDDKFHSIRSLMERFEVQYGVIYEVFQLMKDDGLIRTSPKGSYVI